MSDYCFVRLPNEVEPFISVSFATSVTADSSRLRDRRFLPFPCLTNNRIRLARLLLSTSLFSIVRTVRGADFSPQESWEAKQP